MAEWLFEEGIGEDRAVLIEHGAIVEAAIELPAILRTGAVLEARLTRIAAPRRRGIVVTADDEEALLEPLPAQVTEGQPLRVEIVRESIAEPGRPKLARCRATDAEIRPGPGLRERIAAAGLKIVDHRPPGIDRFEDAGWSELLEQATSGEIPFQGGGLRMSLTPAMTLFDVDGDLPPADLARAGAAAAALAIRRFGIGGSIGIDLPTLSDRGDRQAAAAAFDAVLPPPFERTAVNGFGFLQIVRRRERASLPEILQFDPIGAAARALLRRAERCGGIGARTVHAHPAVIERLEANPGWLDLLARRVGAAVALQAESGLAISAGHVQSTHP